MLGQQPNKAKRASFSDVIAALGALVKVKELSECITALGGLFAVLVKALLEGTAAIVQGALKPLVTIAIAVVVVPFLIIALPFAPFIIWAVKSRSKKPVSSVPARKKKKQISIHEWFGVTDKPVKMQRVK